MKLERRNSSGPEEPGNSAGPMEKKPVVVYIMVMFIAAFLLMAWSFATHQRSNTEAIGRLQSSVTAMEGAQDRVLSLQKELEEAQKAIQELERGAVLRDSELDAYGRQYEALSCLYALERLYRQEDMESCREIIDRIEEEELVVCLSDHLAPLEQELGLAVSDRERYQQLKEAVEAFEAGEGEEQP